MYDVFLAIPVQDRQRALAFIYRPGHDGLLPRDKDGFCPLGRCLEKRLLFNPNIGGAPPSEIVAQIIGTDDNHLSFATLRQVAETFIDDWDANTVPDLRQAMGL